ncbi:MAG: gfo/Idh/MocA family oxidoreductase, partial [Clostridia bacterium]|nr:gfo/Idh/MocA family oxidoreductase [Clostridia bacterium]
SRMIYDGIYGQQARIISNFVKALESGNKEDLIAKAEEGLRGLELINAINQSSWLGKEVNLPLDKEQYAQLLAQKIEEEKTKK